MGAVILRLPRVQQFNPSAHNVRVHTMSLHVMHLHGIVRRLYGPGLCLGGSASMICVETVGGGGGVHAWALLLHYSLHCKAYCNSRGQWEINRG